MRANGLKATVMVGENETVGAHNHARTMPREIDNAVLNGVFVCIEVAVGQLKALGLHLLIHSLWKIIERPHAFVGMQRSC